MKHLSGMNSGQMRHLAETGKVMEPSRRYDCCHYAGCLSEAARINADEIGCTGCGLYSPAPLKPENLRGCIRLLIAVFLPKAHGKISRCNIGDDAFRTVLFDGPKKG